MNTRWDDFLVFGFYLIVIAIFLFPFLALGLREVIG